MESRINVVGNVLCCEPRIANWSTTAATAILGQKKSRRRPEFEQSSLTWRGSPASDIPEGNVQSKGEPSSADLRVSMRSLRVAIRATRPWRRATAMPRLREHALDETVQCPGRDTSRIGPSACWTTRWMRPTAMWHRRVPGLGDVAAFVMRLGGPASLRNPDGRFRRSD